MCVCAQSFAVCYSQMIMMIMFDTTIYLSLRLVIAALILK
jgi:hypothetical protein